MKPDALVVHVEKTSHPTACPTGILRVQRSKLFVLDLHNPEKKYYGVGSAWGLVNDVFGWNQDPRTTSIQIVH
ncbi:MAG: hypothetical protein ABI759_27690 [Candidatus Solibacter sp.]